MVGTLRYCSLNSQSGAELSRRDDLESLGYTIIYMLKGTLPWQGMQGANKREKHDKIYEKKVETPIDELCKTLPIEVARFMYYCRNLKFEEDPDYVELRTMLKSVFKRTHCFKRFDFDWNTMHCDLTTRTKKNSLGSNNAECEEKERKMAPKMSRKMEINQLVSGLTNRSKVSQAPKKKDASPVNIQKEQILFNPFSDVLEEQKLSQRSKENKTNSPDMKFMTEMNDTKSPIEDLNTQKVDKIRRGSVDTILEKFVFRRPKDSFELFLKSDEKPKETDRSSCNFPPTEITERCTAKGIFLNFPNNR